MQRKKSKSRHLKSLGTPIEIETDNPGFSRQSSTTTIDTFQEFEIEVEETPIEMATAAPVTNIIQLTPADFHQIISQAVKQITQNQPAATPTQQIASTKDLKLAEQRPFTGKPEDLDDFINDCELIFSIKSDIYDTDGY